MFVTMWVQADTGIGVVEDQIFNLLYSCQNELKFTLFVKETFLYEVMLAIIMDIVVVVSSRAPK